MVCNHKSFSGLIKKKLFLLSYCVHFVHVLFMVMWTLVLVCFAGCFFSCFFSHACLCHKGRNSLAGGVEVEPY